MLASESRAGVKQLVGGLAPATVRPQGRASLTASIGAVTSIPPRRTRAAAAPNAPDAANPAVTPRRIFSIFIFNYYRLTISDVGCRSDDFPVVFLLATLSSLHYCQAKSPSPQPRVGRCPQHSLDTHLLHRTELSFQPIGYQILVGSCNPLSLPRRSKLTLLPAASPTTHC